MDRKHIENVAELFWKYGRENDWNALVELFAEDCSFKNTIIEKPIIGRHELIKIFSMMKNIHNIREWTAIDGNRLVVGWRERKEDGIENRPWYTGVSSFLFNDEGYIQEYEGTFDAKSCMDSFNYKG